ncbi:hypothetical protein GBAR_LOCUS26163 [Geodia barretti]|uniref:Uncharacterized protein n=1 Tax=Geodia barretti TaxID=519541 RepID=A0AA35TFI5_GEOBA|nr:hypothetical protein GBAR_LOCUS26163 [Geodia barretti]
MPGRAGIGKMASSSGERANNTQGIRIDSSLISTASGGEVENELEGLGVSVFDQGTFEEGVMKQLDEVVTRRAAEQRRKFLVKNYAQVQQEKSTLRRELEALSKKIASLLSRPLCDVVLSLREMKSAQEQKRKQMSQLEVRERELARLISGKDGWNGEIAGENGGVSDAMFAIPPPRC